MNSEAIFINRFIVRYIVYTYSIISYHYYSIEIVLVFSRGRTAAVEENVQPVILRKHTWKKLLFKDRALTHGLTVSANHLMKCAANGA